MIYCPKCGTAHYQNGVFCQKCGYDFRLTPNPGRGNATPMVANSKKSLKGILIFLSLLFVGAVVASFTISPSLLKIIYEQLKTGIDIEATLPVDWNILEYFKALDNDLIHTLYRLEYSLALEMVELKDLIPFLIIFGASLFISKILIKNLKKAKKIYLWLFILLIYVFNTLTSLTIVIFMIDKFTNSTYLVDLFSYLLQALN